MEQQYYIVTPLINWKSSLRIPKSRWYTEKQARALILEREGGPHTPSSCVIDVVPTVTRSYSFWPVNEDVK